MGVVHSRQHAAEATGWACAERAEMPCLVPVPGMATDQPSSRLCRKTSDCVLPLRSSCCSAAHVTKARCSWSLGAWVDGSRRTPSTYRAGRRRRASGRSLGALLAGRGRATCRGPGLVCPVSSFYSSLIKCCFVRQIVVLDPSYFFLHAIQTLKIIC